MQSPSGEKGHTHCFQVPPRQEDICVYRGYVLSHFRATSSPDRTRFRDLEKRKLKWSGGLPSPLEYLDSRHSWWSQEGGLESSSRQSCQPDHLFMASSCFLPQTRTPTKCHGHSAAPGARPPNAEIGGLHPRLHRLCKLQSQVHRGSHLPSSGGPQETLWSYGVSDGTVFLLATDVHLIMSGSRKLNVANLALAVIDCHRFPVIMY